MLKSFDFFKLIVIYFFMFNLSSFLQILNSNIVNAETNFNGKWELIKVEKIDQGRRSKIDFTADTITIFDNGYLFNQKGGFYPAAVKVDNEFHKIKDLKIKAYRSLNKNKFFRQIKQKTKKSKKQILEIRTLDESNSIMTIELISSYKAGFFKAIMGMAMPDEEYKTRKILTYKKKII